MGANVWVCLCKAPQDNFFLLLMFFFLAFFKLWINNEEIQIFTYLYS